MMTRKNTLNLKYIKKVTTTVLIFYLKLKCWIINNQFKKRKHLKITIRQHFFDKDKLSSKIIFEKYF